MTATPQDLARSLIATSESTATVALCLADYADALRRCEDEQERDAVTRQTIRLYAGKDSDHDPHPH